MLFHSLGRSPPVVGLPKNDHVWVASGCSTSATVRCEELPVGRPHHVFGHAGYLPRLSAAAVPIDVGVAGVAQAEREVVASKRATLKLIATIGFAMSPPVNARNFCQVASAFPRCGLHPGRGAACSTSWFGRGGTPKQESASFAAC